MFSITLSFSQTLFKKGYGGNQGFSGHQTTDGGYILSGRKSTTGGGIDIFIIKLNSQGDTTWTKAFGGTVDDMPYQVRQTSDGGYVFTGYTNSFGAGAQDVMLGKVNSSGVLQWIKTYGGTGMDQGQSVQQTSDGGYIVAPPSVVEGKSYRWAPGLELDDPTETRQVIPPGHEHSEAQPKSRHIPFCKLLTEDTFFQDTR